MESSGCFKGNPASRKDAVNALLVPAFLQIQPSPRPAFAWWSTPHGALLQPVPAPSAAGTPPADAGCTAVADVRQSPSPATPPDVGEVRPPADDASSACIGPPQLDDASEPIGVRNAESSFGAVDLHPRQTRLPDIETQDTDPRRPRLQVSHRGNIRRTSTESCCQTSARSSLCAPRSSSAPSR